MGSKVSPLTAEEILSWGKQTHEIKISFAGKTWKVKVRPVTVADTGWIRQQARARANAEGRHSFEEWTGIYTIHRALVEPKLSVEEIEQLPFGVQVKLSFKINEISGLTADLTNLLMGTQEETF